MKKTSDATKQSVKCQYSHQWVKDGNERNPATGDFAVKCEKCGTTPKAKESESATALVDLRELVKPGSTVYTTLRHVSRSGMQRVIDMHLIIDNEPRWIGYTAAKALDDRYDDRKQGIVVGGCGMDMGFHLVYGLSRRLFPEFKCSGKGCRSNDHSNGDRDYTPGKPHSDGGYALNHRWM